MKNDPYELIEQARFRPRNGHELRAMRKQLGLSRAQVAEVLDISRQTITNLESERNLYMPLLVMYEAFLERYFAADHGYLPSFRKAGENAYAELILKLPNDPNIYWHSMKSDIPKEEADPYLVTDGESIDIGYWHEATGTWNASIEIVTHWLPIKHFIPPIPKSSRKAKEISA